jgi:beta-phosphoglucomutase
MKKLGLMPNECMIVEDNENGIKAAIASKAWVMKVENVEEVNYFNIKKNIKFFEGKM